MPDEESYAVGQPVTFREPVIECDRAKFLPGDRAWVVSPPTSNGHRVRVRCPDTAEDGWVNVTQIVARKKEGD